MGWRHAMIHAVFGMRINGAWGMVLREKLRRVFGIVAEASHVDDGILLSFAPGQVPPAPERLVTLVAPEEVDTLLGRALIGTPLFATRFRHCAVRGLFIPRMSRGRRTPAYLQRLKADALLESVGGQPEFPVVAETLRECFNDALDVTRLKRLLERLHDGEMWRRHVDTPLPSPFVYPLLLAWDWAYLGAGHAEERRSDAVTMRKAWSVAAGPLRPEIVAAVEAELQKTSPDRRARDANELAGILDDLGDLTAAEIAARALDDGEGMIAALAAEHRVLVLEFPSGRKAWAGATDAALYGSLATDAGLERVTLRLLRTRGPATAACWRRSSCSRARTFRCASGSRISCPPGSKTTSASGWTGWGSPARWRGPCSTRHRASAGARRAWARPCARTSGGSARTAARRPSWTRASRTSSCTSSCGAPRSPRISGAPPASARRTFSPRCGSSSGPVW